MWACILVASYPGSWWAGRKRAWYLLFAHARNYPLLNTCSDKGGRRMCNTYPRDWYCDVQFSKYSNVQRRAKQPHYSLNYTALSRYKFLLTYSLWQTVTQWYHTDLPGSSQQKSEVGATCTFFRLIQQVPSRWRELESPGERAIKTLPSLDRKCADDVAVSIRYVVTVIRI